jgi:hypothetical protein
MSSDGKLDARDVRAGVLRYTLNVDEAMALINRARLEREYEEMRVEADALIAKLSAVHGREFLKVSYAINKLWKQMDKNIDERFPSESTP